MKNKIQEEFILTLMEYQGKFWLTESEEIIVFDGGEPISLCYQNRGKIVLPIVIARSLMSESKEGTKVTKRFIKTYHDKNGIELVNTHDINKVKPLCHWVDDGLFYVLTDNGLIRIEHSDISGGLWVHWRESCYYTKTKKLGCNTLGANYIFKNTITANYILSLRKELEDVKKEAKAEKELRLSYQEHVEAYADIKKVT